MVILVTTQTEIAASPAAVREKFLDFAQIPTYHPVPPGHLKSWIVSVAPGPKNPKAAVELVPGDVMHCVVGRGSMDLSPVLVENSPTAFTWGGSVPLIFSGEHTFRFEPIAGQPNKTLFKHEERFGGAFAFVMGDSWFANRFLGWREKTLVGFKEYNGDLKAWVEAGRETL